MFTNSMLLTVKFFSGVTKLHFEIVIQYLFLSILLFVYFPDSLNPTEILSKCPLVVVARKSRFVVGTDKALSNWYSKVRSFK